MVIPTLLVKGSLIPLNPKVKKEELDNYIAVHYILELLRYKLEKKNPNIHDRIFLLKSLVGSGKTTAFIVETFRRFFNTRPGPENAAKYREKIDSDFGVYDFPDDEYTIQNRKDGISETVKQGHRILCSQPKIILAIEKATEIAGEPFNPDLELYENVGYSTGGFKSAINPNSHIMYCTMGTMAMMIKNKPNSEWLQNYEIIAIDECHERSLELDEGMVYLRALLQRNAGNPAFPIVVCMSATFDVKKYADYLGTYPENAVLVEGGAVSREFHYIDYDPEMIYPATAEMVYKLHKDNYDDPEDHCDMLIFGPGDGELKNIMGNIAKLDVDKELYIGKITKDLNSKGGPEKDYIMHMSLAELRKILNMPKLRRRVTVATPVVETGLTINTLKYVIDTGLVKSTAYSPIHNLSQLLTQPCSQSSLEQRAGRAGTVKFGYIYRMMQKHLVEQVDEYSRPDIFTKDLSKVFLDMMYSGFDNELAVKPISKTTFELFLANCLNVPGFKLTSDTENCKCLYTDIMTKKSEILESKKFLEDIILKNYPNIMLDKVPLDVYTIARNKLISLGFYGTYIGYLASKITRLSVQSIRMVMAGLAYGVNLNDLITIGIFVDTAEQKYKYGMRAVMMARKDKKNKSNIKPYRLSNILEKVISRAVIVKHFGGNTDLLTNQFYDDFMEPLFIMRWYAQTVRKLGPNRVIEKGKEMGLDVALIYRILDCRTQIQESFKKVGFVSTAAEIDFNSDSCFDQIIRIKKCIHAGYKNNLAYLQSDGVKYKTNTGLIITPREFFIKFKPKKIVYGSLFMNVRADSIFYDPTPIYICSLDGII